MAPTDTKSSRTCQHPKHSTHTHNLAWLHDRRHPATATHALPLLQKLSQNTSQRLSRKHNVLLAARRHLKTSARATSTSSSRRYSSATTSARSAPPPEASRPPLRQGRRGSAHPKRKTLRLRGHIAFSARQTPRARRPTKHSKSPATGPHAWHHRQAPNKRSSGRSKTLPFFLSPSSSSFSSRLPSPFSAAYTPELGQLHPGTHPRPKCLHPEPPPHPHADAATATTRRPWLHQGAPQPLPSDITSQPCPTRKEKNSQDENKGEAQVKGKATTANTRALQAEKTRGQEGKLQLHQRGTTACPAGNRETLTHLPGTAARTGSAPALSHPPPNRYSQPPPNTPPPPHARPPHQRTSPRPPQPPAKTENHSRKLAAVRKRGRESRGTT